MSIQFKLIKANNYAITLSLVSLLALSLLSLIMTYLTYNFAFDDSYIMHRFVKNFAEHNEIAFNQGVPYEGTSSISWVITIGLLEKFFSMGAITTSKIMGALFMFSTSIIGAYLIFKELSKSTIAINAFIVSFLTAALIISSPSFSSWSLSGLEGSLYSLALLITIYITTTKGSFLAAIFFYILLTLTRVEGLIFISIPAFLYIYDKTLKLTPFIFNTLKKLALFYVIVFIYIVAITLWRYIYFGDFVPATVLYKAPHSSLFETLYLGLRYIGSYAINNPFLSISFIFCLFFAKTWYKNLISITSLYVFILQLLLIIVVGGDWMGPDRFFAAFIPVLIVFLVNSFYIIGTTLSYKKATLVVSLFCIGGYLFNSAYALKIVMTNQGMNRALTETNLKLAQFISDNSSKSDLIAIGDGGVVPYYTNLPIIDLHGLLDRHLRDYAGNFSTNPHSDIDLNYLFNANPTWIVLITSKPPTKSEIEPAYKLYDMIAKDSRFKSNYDYYDSWKLFDRYYYSLYYNKSKLKYVTVKFKLNSDNKQLRGEVYFNNLSAPYVFNYDTTPKEFAFKGFIRDNIVRLDLGDLKDIASTVTDISSTCNNHSLQPKLPISGNQIEVIAQSSRQATYKSNSNDPYIFINVCDH